MDIRIRRASKCLLRHNSRVLLLVFSVDVLPPLENGKKYIICLIVHPPIHFTSINFMWFYGVFVCVGPCDWGGGGVFRGASTSMVYAPNQTTN
jgi:hypothetical protein